MRGECALSHLDRLTKASHPPGRLAVVIEVGGREGAACVGATQQLDRLRPAMLGERDPGAVGAGFGVG